MVKNTFEKIKEYFINKKCVLLTKKEDYKNAYKQKLNYIAECGHHHKNSFKAFKECKFNVCRKCSLYKRKSISYEQVLKSFNDKKCKLLLTKKEYKNTKQEVKYIASCGHNNTIKIEVFRSKNSGVKCVKCSRLKPHRKDNIIKYKDTNKTETEGIKLLRSQYNFKYLENTFEKCLADLVFRPNDILDNLWLPIQIKTRSKTGKCFNNTHKYKNMILICICLETKNIWIFDGSDMKCKTIVIGEKSKYNDFLVNKKEIYKILCNYYKNKNYCKTKIEFIIPNDVTTKKEYEYYNLKINKLNFLNLKRPDVEHLAYDFIIDNYKIQDKCAYIRKDSKNEVIKCVAKKNIGKGKRAPYEEGDFDYIWINLPDKYKETYFYLIPSTKLIDLEIMKTKKQKGKLSFSLYPEGIEHMKYKSRIKTECLNDYLFEYSKINENTNIFN